MSACPSAWSSGVVGLVPAILALGPQSSVAAAGTPCLLDSSSSVGPGVSTALLGGLVLWKPSRLLWALLSHVVSQLLGAVCAVFAVTAELIARALPCEVLTASEGLGGFPAGDQVLSARCAFICWKGRARETGSLSPADPAVARVEPG